MTAPAIVISLFGIMVLGGGTISYFDSASITSLIAGGTSGLGLLVGGLGPDHFVRLKLMDRLIETGAPQQDYVVYHAQ